MPARSRGALKRQLYRLAVGRSDVNQAFSACRLMLAEVKDMGDDLYQPLLHSIVISYARPFVMTRAGSTIGPKWGRFDCAILQDTHDRLLELRHKFVAHSDPMKRTINVMPPGVPLYEGGEPQFTKPGLIVRDVWYPMEWFDTVSATVLDLGGRLHAEVERMLHELYGNRALPSEPFPLTFDDDL